ncbi:MAG: NAD(P)/FAD-dependent oxidoreductase [Candidatus Diapherotrites archaeon]|nr:NAD(P)/FAD-dependent oxidoreductase [Candidatus Diapherotrites archaeon]
MEEFDVIIIGGSVAGLRSAEQLAKRGLSVLCLERKQEIGVPKHCGEGLGLGHFKRLGLKPDKRWCAAAMKGAILYTPTGKKVEIKFDKTVGYILERKQFEKYLAEKAAKAGAVTRVRSNVSEIKREKGGVKVTVKDLFEAEYFGKMLFACDGTAGIASRSLGLENSIQASDLDSGIQYEMVGIDFDQPDMIHLWFGNDVAPRGYVWLFPKGKNHANVGIGIGSHLGKPAAFYLNKWIDARPEIKKGSIMEVNSGIIPVGGLLEKMTADNLMLVGDAAHQVNPIHGGGMGLAMEAADLAAEVAAKAFKKNDLSNSALQEYNSRWWEKTGVKLKRILQIRYMMESLSDKDYEALAENFTGEEIMKLQGGSLGESAKLVTTKLIRKPGLMKLMLKYLAPKEGRGK